MKIQIGTLVVVKSVEYIGIVTEEVRGGWWVVKFCLPFGTNTIATEDLIPILNLQEPDKSSALNSSLGLVRVIEKHLPDITEKLKGQIKDLSETIGYLTRTLERMSKLAPLDTSQIFKENIKTSTF